MLTLLLILACSAGYIFIGFVTNRLATNAYFNKAYREIMKRGVSIPFYEKREGMSDIEIEYRKRKEAWSRAQGDIDAQCNSEIFGVLGGIFWPIAAPIFILYFTLTRIDTSNLLKPSVVKELEEYEGRVNAENTRKAEWNKMLEDAEALGLDVKGLKKL
jgi:hypothetical protein